VIDAVVVTRDSPELVRQSVDRLVSPLLELVVAVDNGSVEPLRLERRGMRIVRLDPAQGLAAAYNRGADAGSAAFVLFLNDDVFATEESINALADALDRPDAVAAAGRLVDPEGGATQEAYLPRAFPTAFDLAAALLGRQRPHLPGLSDETVAVDQPPGACLLVRREVLEQVGGWHEGFDLWFEDVDLARRLVEVGEVLFVPSATFAHVGGASARRLSRAEVVSRSYGGALLYAQRHLGWRGRAVTAPAYAFVAAGRLLTTRDRESRRAYAGVLRGAARLAFGRPL